MQLRGPVYLISIMLFISGCAQIETAIEDFQAAQDQQRLETFEESTDKQLVEALYEVSEDGSERSPVPSIREDGFSLAQVSRSAVSFEKEMFSRPNMDSVRRDMNSYRSEAEEDAVAKAYAEVAEDRGNEVRVYRPQLGERLARMYQTPVGDYDESAEWFDRDRVLIEFEDERPVSVLFRSHQARTSVGVTSNQYATVIMGDENIRHLEDTITRSELEEEYIGEM